MEKKQSSIDWLEQQFNTIREQGNIEVENLIWQQAKAMHKKEIVDAFGIGAHYKSTSLIGYHSMADDYYNETFGGNNE